jgi:hypothetical protein
MTIYQLLGNLGYQELADSLGEEAKQEKIIIETADEYYFDIKEIYFLSNRTTILRLYAKAKEEC